MVIAAFILLGIAVLLGTWLAVPYFRSETAAAPHWMLAALHLCFALAGFCCLLLALEGPPRGLKTGTASFGLIAAALLGLAAIMGGGFLIVHLLKRRLPGVAIGTHATLAISGFVILAAYVFAG